MNLFRSISLAVAGAVALSSSVAFADAITLDSSSVGQSFQLNYGGMADGQPIPNLTGVTTLKLTGITGTSYAFDYSVWNTGTTGDSVNSRISSFGFDTNPDITGAASTGTYDNALLGGQVPSPFNTVDVCFKASGSNSCSGSGGLFDGEIGSGTLSLDFASAPTSLQLSDFFVRYQSITGLGNITSATGSGTIVSSGGSTGGTPVPEPGMIGLFGLGLIGLALMRRRQSPRGRTPRFAAA